MKLVCTARAALNFLSLMKVVSLIYNKLAMCLQ